jgi:RNA polymerase sigma-70 factor (ECF subfamily)
MKLREVLTRDYLKIKSRLMRRFGSADFATEVLHETYLRLGAAESGGSVQNVDAYLYRATLNVAADARKDERRWVDKVAIEATLHRDDHELDPEEIFQARQEWGAMVAAIDELPQRRRAIFLAARLEEIPRRDIAERLNISVDTVDHELKRALDFFAKRLDKKISKKRRGSGPVEPS